MVCSYQIFVGTIEFAAINFILSYEMLLQVYDFMPCTVAFLGYRIVLSEFFCLLYFNFCRKLHEKIAVEIQFIL